MFVTEGSQFPGIWAALGILSLVALNIETNAARKVVLGNGLGYLAMTGAFLYKRFLTDSVNLPPDGGLVLWGVLTVWMLIAGFGQLAAESKPNVKERLSRLNDLT